jgi:hypothetical protein
MQPHALYEALKARRSFNMYELLPDPIAPA